MQWKTIKTIQRIKHRQGHTQTRYSGLLMACKIMKRGQEASRLKGCIHFLTLRIFIKRTLMVVKNLSVVVLKKDQRLEVIPSVPRLRITSKEWTQNQQLFYEVQTITVLRMNSTNRLISRWRTQETLRFKSAKSLKWTGITLSIKKMQREIRLLLLLKEEEGPLRKRQSSTGKASPLKMDKYPHLIR